MKSIVTSALFLFAAMTALASTVVISWTAQPPTAGVSAYNIYVSTNGGPSVLLDSAPSNSYNFVDPDAGIYTFRIAAVNLAGIGPQSTPVSTPGLPSIPANVTAATTNTTITVSWTQNAAGQFVTSYNVYVSTNAGPYTLAQSVATPPAVFANLDTGLYAFKVAAVNLAGEGAQSVSASGPALPGPVINPTLTIIP